MTDPRTIWLIHNDSSGSNDREALDELESTCSDCGLQIAWRTSFPTEELPTPAMLDAAGADIVAVFAGDGTVNAALKTLSGWSGSVLILPGGTMNLLYHRLFGDLDTGAALQAVAAGEAQPRRPGIITSAAGHAFTDLLAGPGTSWNGVREAMRNIDVAGLASETTAAFSRTLSGEPVLCREPALGREEGYPLLQLEPHDRHILVKAYHAETAERFIEQLLALVNRDFRSGPYDELGTVERVVLAGPDGAGMDLLLDGEPATTQEACEFVLARCQVDLLATVAND